MATVSQPTQPSACNTNSRGQQGWLHLRSANPSFPSLLFLVLHERILPLRGGPGTRERCSSYLLEKSLSPSTVGQTSVMSTALTNAAHLKPDIRLADAISQFQADLTSREKEIFTECRDQSVHSTPTIWDVSRVTAEIDRHPSWQGRASGRRCFGPRFMKLLEAVQQFASIGDVVVGGSQNIIACGVWSLVRMTLLVWSTL